MVCGVKRSGYKIKTDSKSIKKTGKREEKPKVFIAVIIDWWEYFYSSEKYFLYVPQ